MRHQEDIIALSTAPGEGAIALIRLSGRTVIDQVDKISKASLREVDSHKAVYTELVDDEGKVIDDSVLIVYRAPRSYTTEDIVEINCHGSPYVVQRIMTELLSRGVRMADPGEFTLRAYLNGRLDLTQAEAVADLIASQSASQHEMAIHQMRGGFSDKIRLLREELIHFASLIELENDFSEEDVEFADRGELMTRLGKVRDSINSLASSFGLGNALKNGIPVAIIGPPNAGKSTLLNALLQDDRAIVSAIPGTTRDVIEDTINIEGVLYRFIDTAGLRETEDSIEKMGIERSHQQISRAHIILHVLPIELEMSELIGQVKSIPLQENQQRIVVLNKMDTIPGCLSYDLEEALSTHLGRSPVVAISAEKKLHLDQIQALLQDIVRKSRRNQSDTLITNARHHQALVEAAEHIEIVLDGFDTGITTDLLALDLRYALTALSGIIGEVQTDDLLENIFSKFCIGK